MEFRNLMDDGARLDAEVRLDCFDGTFCNLLLGKAVAEVSGFQLEGNCIFVKIYANSYEGLQKEAKERQDWFAERLSGLRRLGESLKILKRYEELKVGN